MITFKVEDFADVMEELKPMFEEHWHEVAVYQDKIDLSPDYDKYCGLPDDSLVTVIAREEGKAVGYSIYFVSPHIHYKDHLYAVNDIVFVDPEYRHGKTAPDMLDYAEAYLVELGCSVVTMHMKKHIPFESLMDYLEYDRIETIYTKYIGK